MKSHHLQIDVRFRADNFMAQLRCITGALDAKSPRHLQIELAALDALQEVQRMTAAATREIGQQPSPIDIQMRVDLARINQQDLPAPDEPKELIQLRKWFPANHDGYKPVWFQQMHAVFKYIDGLRTGKSTVK